MQIILDSHFKILERFLDEVQYWDIDFRLLGVSGFEGSLKQLFSQNVLLTYARYQGNLNHLGATPPGYRTFVIPRDTCRDFLWRGYKITQNDLLIFPNSNELHGSSISNFEVFTVSVHLNYIEQLIDDFCLKKIPDKQEVVHMDAPVAQELRNLATTITRSSGGEAAQILAHELAEKLVIATADSSSKRIPNLRRRDMAVDKVVEFVRNTPVPTADLARLCRIANVSERTLEYAFKERYGIAPSVFVKCWKLNTIRRQLLAANPVETNISALSQRFGFLHQSQFAADYKKLFAELPSQTLKS